MLLKLNYLQILDQHMMLVDTMNLSMNYLYLLAMLIQDSLSWGYLLLGHDTVVDKDNPNMSALDLKSKMLLRPSKTDTVHQLVKNDLQMNSDKLLDQMMITVVFLCYY